MFISHKNMELKVSEPIITIQLTRSEGIFLRELLRHGYSNESFIDKDTRVYMYKLVKEELEKIAKERELNHGNHN